MRFIQHMMSVLSIAFDNITLSHTYIHVEEAH